MIKLSRWTTGGLESVTSMHPLPLQGAECVIQHSVPLGVVAHDTLFLPAVAFFFPSCGGHDVGLLFGVLQSCPMSCATCLG